MFVCSASLEMVIHVLIHSFASPHIGGEDFIKGKGNYLSTLEILLFILTFMENLFIPNVPFVTDMIVGNTAFRQAIIDDKLELVKDMLDKGIVQVEDKYMMHMRAIHYACQVCASDARDRSLFHSHLLPRHAPF